MKIRVPGNSKMVGNNGALSVGGETKHKKKGREGAIARHQGTCVVRKGFALKRGIINRRERD